MVAASTYFEHSLGARERDARLAKERQVARCYKISCLCKLNASHRWKKLCATHRTSKKNNLESHFSVTRAFITLVLPGMLPAPCWGPGPCVTEEDHHGHFVCERSVAAVVRSAGSRRSPGACCPQAAVGPARGPAAQGSAPSAVALANAQPGRSESKACGWVAGQIELLFLASYKGFLKNRAGSSSHLPVNTKNQEEPRTDPQLCQLRQIP